MEMKKIKYAPDCESKLIDAYQIARSPDNHYLVYVPKEKTKHGYLDFCYENNNNYYSLKDLDTEIYLLLDHSSEKLFDNIVQVAGIK